MDRFRVTELGNASLIKTTGPSFSAAVVLQDLSFILSWNILGVRLLQISQENPSKVG